MLDFPLNFILLRGAVLFFLYHSAVFGVIAKSGHPQVNLFLFLTEGRAVVP